MKSGTERGRELGLSIALGVLTLCTTLWAGLYHGGGEADSFGELLRSGAAWRAAAAHAVALLCILLAHEFGHWFTARRHGVRVSPPLLLPGIPPIGTFGAAIRMELEPMRAGSLIRIAAWGPIAGFVALLPFLVVGVMLSEVKPLPEDVSGLLLLGDPLLLQGVVLQVHGVIPEGQELFLHPVAFAAWTGMLLTALNLLPVGQLDGGHVAYALLGDRAVWVSRGALLVLVVLGLWGYPGWLVLAGLVAFVIGVRHPPVALEGPVSRAEAGLALLALVLFIVTFTPAPIVPSA
ncbi:MAG: site-2 protease family protein [Deltaproteobacteria bacterium]|nr:MAG: site-2 protease family protein [Deltaproteobacteria bacterium]